MNLGLVAVAAAALSVAPGAGYIYPPVLPAGRGRGWGREGRGLRGRGRVLSGSREIDGSDPATHA